MVEGDGVVVDVESELHAPRRWLGPPAIRCRVGMVPASIELHPLRTLKDTSLPNSLHLNNDS